MRYIGGVDQSSLDHDVLKALAQFPERTPVHPRELATELGEAVQSVAARLQPLVDLPPLEPETALRAFLPQIDNAAQGRKRTP